MIHKQIVRLALSGLFFSLTLSLLAQDATVFGTVTDGETTEPMIGVTVFVEGTQLGTTTDIDGKYRLRVPAGRQRIVFSYIGYEPYVETVTLTAGADRRLDLTLAATTSILQTATVTSGRYEKPLGEVTVSLEVIKPGLVESSNQLSLDGVLDKVPGVTMVDGQANIRGGSGYSYGAGSRVLLLVDDIPILQSDAGFPNWDDVPIENLEQIEVVKGAASALYGSSAMNGIVNVRTGFAKADPETKVSLFASTFDAPSIDGAKWWDEPRQSIGASLRHARKMGKLDLVLSGFYNNEESFLQNTFDRYGRATTNLRYRISDRLTVGVNANFNKGSNSSFFFWGGLDSLILRPAEGTISRGRPTRFNIDPRVTFFDRAGNRHKLLGRYYNVDNQNNNNQSNASELAYAEYQFLRRFEGADLVMTAGVVGQGTWVSAELYGDTTYRSQNLAAYVQFDKKFGDRLNLSAGMRYEANALYTPERVAGVEIPGGKVTESKPVFRFGANYRAAEATFFRASWGQGYRYPTIAEKFIQTTFGGIMISPNPAARSETGWSAELAVKQGYRLGGFEGFIDLAAFWSEYQDMLEFSFTDLFQTGFQSLNVGDTRINGFEVSTGGRGALGQVQVNLLAGYTYINPLFQDFDSNIPPVGEPRTQAQRNAELSSADYNVLKYRSKHTGKLDIEFIYNKFSLGVASIYNSRVEAVDWIFEAFIVPDLVEWRAEETGTAILNLRTAYRFTEDIKLSFLVNNTLNEAYSNRPGLLEAPRNFALRLDLQL
jgi:iron complex outermembrane receptor protein